LKPSYLKFLGICVTVTAGFGLPLYSSAQKKTSSTSVRQQSLSKLLGWVDAPNANNLCHGYYKQTNLRIPKYLNANKTLIRSKDATYYADKPSILHNVTVLQQGRILTADEAYSQVSAKQNWQANDIHLKGNVHLHEAGILAIADSGTVNIKHNSAILHNLAYRANIANTINQQYNSSDDLRNANIPKNILIDNDNQASQNSAFTARGTASSAKQLKPKIITLYNATYSTCPPNRNSWYLKSSRITLDKNSGDGTAVNARIYVHGVPIFYFPYFNFPIDNKRRSGFLFPNLGFSSSDGFHLSVPYYWNIASNYDDTITPTYYSKRGIRIENLFRYLTWRRMGQIYFSVLPNDHEFNNFQHSAVTNPEYNTQPGFQRLQQDSTNRLYFSLYDQNIINSNWSNKVNVNYVSDDYYFQDFSNKLNTLEQNQLLQYAGINYDSQHIHATGYLQNYQTLHPVNNTAIINDQYARYPDIVFDANYPNQSLLSYALNGEFVNFRWPLITENYEPNLPRVTGQRYNLAPSISLPLYGASYHFIPQVEYDATAYQLQSPIPTQQKELNRGVPIFDIDAGLLFQRKLTLFGDHYFQTLEPRFYYVYIPYRDQNNLPVFDGSTQTFTYNSIFENNRFTSIDRIGDTNRLGYSLTSRLINSDTGTGQVTASIGQITYFTDRRVTSPDTNSFIVNNDSRTSPIVGQLTMSLSHHWYASANAAWKPGEHTLNNSGLTLEYLKNSQDTFSINYNFLKDGDPLPNTTNLNSSFNNLDQVQIAGSWKVHNRWGLYSSINYNISHHYTQNYLYGVQYSNCCWALRVVATRNFIGLNTDNRPNYDNGVAIQISLNGLGSVGSGSSSNALEQNIPGYRDEFGQGTLVKT